MNKRVIHTVFEDVALRQPSLIAAETEKHEFTYAQLNTQCNILSSLLRSMQLLNTDVCAVLFEDRLCQLISLLGIFKSGSIYMPLDKKYNKNHWTELYEKIQPKIMLSNKETIQLLLEYNTSCSYSIPYLLDIAVNDHKKIIPTLYQYDGKDYKSIAISNDLLEDNFELEITGEDANYIFFTSGSTGTPKAVLGKHKSLSHYIHWESKVLQVESTDRLGQLISYSFDASLKDVFMSLINGATLCIPSEEIKQDTAALIHWIREKKISLLHMVPTLFRVLSSFGKTTNSLDIEPFPSLKYVLLAGEKLYGKDIVSWRKHYGNSTTIYNFYGTTESTILSTFYRVEEEVFDDISEVLCVGQPISNTKIMILNKDHKLCRINEKGSVYIRTPFLSQGYYNDPIQTSEKFVQNPLRDEAELIYKTGDQGAYNQNKDVVIYGREDGVMKLNGVRIDLNSIEAVILRLGDILTVKCMIYQQDTLNASLVCFYKSQHIGEEQLRNHCSDYLSQYEVPSMIFRLDEFPSLANGKIDSTALRISIADRFEAESTVEEPFNPIEEKLSRLWKEVLEVGVSSKNASFLSLGGNSIKQVLLRSRIKSAFNLDLSIEALFVNDTLSKQALFIKPLLKTVPTLETDIIERVAPNSEGYGLSVEQMRIWITCQSKAESISHNMPHTYKVHGEIAINRFKKALNYIIKKHEALRTYFTENVKNGVVQKVEENVETSNFFEFVSKAEKISDKEIEKRTNALAKMVFNLSEAPLFRVLLIEKSQSEYILSTVMHHIIGDYTSDQIIFTELMQQYNGVVNSDNVEMSAQEITYKDYAQWMNLKLENNGFSKDSRFWKSYLKGIGKQDKWYAGAGSNDFNGAYYIEYLPQKQLVDIRAYCVRLGVNPMALFATALGLLLHKKSGQKDIVIGTPTNLRNHPDLIDKVGLYLNLLPLRIGMQPQDKIDAIVKETSKSQTKLLDHSFYPLDAILEDFEQDHRFNLIDRIDVYLNYLSVKQSPINFKNLEIIPQERSSKMSKFPICFYVSMAKDSCSFRIEYQTSVFSEVEIKTLGERFSTALSKISANKDITVAAIGLVNAASIPAFTFK